jgi:RHS repeat-associated protein
MHFLHPDHLGSPRLITDDQGNTVAEHVYFPFGEEATPPATDEVLKFTGHERDPLGPGTTDDLDYMHARYFSAHLGRFLSLDPTKRSARQELPQSWNRYAYTVSNPLKYVDPDGEAWRPPEDASPLEIAVARALMSDPGIGPAAMSAGPRIGLSLLAKVGLRLSSKRGLLGAVGRVLIKPTLLRAASQPSKNRLTAAGRALQKHSDRPGSAFKATSNKPSGLNREGQKVVDDILSDPDAKLVERVIKIEGQEVSVVDVVASDGRAVRFTADGTELIGFREPPPE